MRPLIGLSTYREQTRWGVWDTMADVLPASYAQAIERAGGVPVLLPPGNVNAGAAAIIARLDGLVITGGADLDPRLYDAEPHPRTTPWRSDRDRWEWELLDAAADEAELPTLGICRGMQLMAVHAGGTLDQHTPDLVGDDSHSPGGDVFGDVDVTIRPGSRLGSILGSQVRVGCHHHQSVREHPGFTGVGHAVDGTLEAMEHPGDRFCLAVQWHPEVRDDAGLFAALIKASAATAP